MEECKGIALYADGIITEESGDKQLIIALENIFLGQFVIGLLSCCI